MLRARTLCRAASRRAVLSFVRVPAVFLLAALLSAQPLTAPLAAPSVSAAEAQPSIGNGATILTGKVVTTVTRAVPVPFNAVVDQVLVKPGASFALPPAGRSGTCSAARSHHWRGH